MSHETFTPKIIGPTVEARRLKSITLDPNGSLISAVYEYGTDEAGVFIPTEGIPLEPVKYTFNEVWDGDDQTALDGLLDTLFTHHQTQHPA